MSSGVLLVETDSKVAELVAEGLRQTIPNISIEYVNSLPQALDFLFHTGNRSFQEYEQKPDLIVMGLDLPDDGSIELLRVLKAYLHTQKIPILLLADPSTLIPTLEHSPLDVNRFILKTDNRKEFVGAVSRAGAYWMNGESLPSGIASSVH